MIRISTYLSIALFGLVCGGCDSEMSVATEASAHTADGTANEQAERPSNEHDPRGNATQTERSEQEPQSRNPEESDFYPLPDEEGVGQAPDESAEADDDGDDSLSGVVNLNEANLETLQLLPGIGPAIASRIDSYRQKRRFENPDDIMRVRGIGDATFEKLESHLSVDGPTTLKE